MSWKQLPASEIGSPSDVHVFGDSHSFFCFSKIEKVKVHWLGPHTMHRVGRDGLLGLSLATFGVQNNDTCIFVFGEIDVRCHIGLQIALHARNEDEIIETLVNQYIDTIDLNRKLFQNLHCVIFAVLPPSDNGYNPDFPFYGPLEERVRLTRKLNQYLKSAAQASGIYFFDVSENYATPLGSLNSALSDGQVHVNPDCIGPIKEGLEKLLKQIYQN